MENFGTWLLFELEKRGLNQSDLSKLSGLSRGTLSNLVNGTRGFGPDSLAAIARALKLPAEEVFRAAGILPQVKEKSAQISKFDHLLETLSAEDIEDLYAVARAKVERMEEKARAAKMKKPAVQTR
jgi:transcriptional regulator with XRE-family HTH domain